MGGASWGPVSILAIPQSPGSLPRMSPVGICGVPPSLSLQLEESPQTLFLPSGDWGPTPADVGTCLAYLLTPTAAPHLSPSPHREGLQPRPG